MDNLTFINMYTLPEGISISVFTNKHDIHNTILEVQHHNKRKNLLLEGSKMFSKISQIVFPDKPSIFILDNTFYHEISQEEINKYLDCTWFNQYSC